MRDPNLRASDADRERVADELREQCAQGRLTLEEFHSRLDTCFTARTYGDLDALVADLPGPGPYDDLPVPASRREGALPMLPHEAAPAPWRTAIGSYLTVNLVCWLIWAVTGAGGPIPWPVWVSGPWGAVLLGWAVSGNWSGEQRRRRP